MTMNKTINRLPLFSCLAIIILLLGIAPTEAKSEAQGYRFLIYYGIPEGVNNLWDVDKAVNIFSEYDYLVLGSKLQLPSHSHNESTKQIIKKLNNIKASTIVFGYVDLGVTTDNLTMSALKESVDHWKSMGVQGIFFDDAGYDYHVSRSRFNEAVVYVHNVGLSAFINAWHPDDVMGNTIHATYNPKGVKSQLGNNDYYLLEDFLQPTDIATSNSPSAFTPHFRQKIDKVLAYREKLGVRLMSVSIIDYDSYSSNSVRKFFRMNEAAAGIFSLDGYGIAPLHYSSSKVSGDTVISNPYITNFMSYHTTKVKYIAKYNDQDFSRKDFRLHSEKNKHFYNYPETVEYK